MPIFPVRITKPAVPTWNYIAVHINGVAKVLPTEQNLAVVKRVLQIYESGNAKNHEIYEPDYLEKLSRAIVSFHIKVRQVVGKKKPGQNKKAVDQDATLSKLEASSLHSDKELADFIRNW